MLRWQGGRYPETPAPRSCSPAIHMDLAEIKVPLLTLLSPYQVFSIHLYHCQCQDHLPGLPPLGQSPLVCFPKSKSDHITTLLKPVPPHCPPHEPRSLREALFTALSPSQTCWMALSPETTGFGLQHKNPLTRPLLTHPAHSVDAASPIP